MSNNPVFYSEDIKKIEHVEFSIYRNKDVLAYSAVSNDSFGINLAESYENYEPKKGGLVDLRLGTCDPYLPCTTCGLDYINCVGHFGHTLLAEHVFHFGFLQHLKNILQCICLKCSNLLIEKTDTHFRRALQKKSDVRFKEIKVLSKNITYCHTCGVPVPKIKREVKDNGSIKIIIERTINYVLDEKQGEILEQKKLKESLNPRDCYNILRNISDDDCFLLGFNPVRQRPEDLIIYIFPIPPVVIRPSNKIDFLSSSTMEDSLTLKISDIITSNKRVRQQMEKTTTLNELSNYSQDIFNLLQYHVAIYFDNESVSLPRTEFKVGGKQIKSISERIKGKFGRIRSNLLGKRVDFSARSVITPDAYIGIDELGIPKKIAMELTVPEEVTAENIIKLTELVKRGSNNYPGANFISHINYRDGKPEIQKIDLKYRKKDIKLNFGDIVDRHCINGDYVLFNRQPTLHKPSMMAHRIVVMETDDTYTFRMNLSVVRPYNADFDGDEMNIFLPQSIQAMNELKMLANVKYQIIGSKDSSPIIGCGQDTLTGAYSLTNLGKKIKGYELANIVCNTTSPKKLDIKMDKMYTGHEAFSYIIPEGINSIKKSGDKIIFEIVDGILLKGTLDKSALSYSKNSIIHFIWDKFGPNKTRDFIDDAQKFILNYLLLDGQSVGFKEVVIDKKTLEHANQIVINKILESKYNITQFENDIDQLPLSTIETSLASELNIIAGQVGQILITKLLPTNFFFNNGKSGGKASAVNISKMTGVVGQINLLNERIKKKIEKRTLIYFHSDDDTPEARGFINNCYMNGLKGIEYFYDLIAGRQGAIASAISTASVGYVSRQLVKSLEDIIIKYDGTNRNAKGIIIQLVYGENGISQSAQTEVLLNILSMDNITLENELGFSSDEIKKLDKTNSLKEFNTKYVNKLKKYRDDLRYLQYNATLNYKILEDKYMLPVNLFRITQDYTNKDKDASIDTTLKPQDIIDAINEFLINYDNRIITCLKPTDIMMKNDDIDLKFVLKVALHEYLCPKKCIFQYKLSKSDFINMMKEIKLNFIKAIVEPGEMVGIVAAQSVGEPTQQITLNEKHSAGAKKAGSGLVRIQEIIHFSKSIKYPKMMVYFDKEYSKDRNKLNKLISYFKFLSIRDLIKDAEIYYYVNNNNNELSKKINNDNVTKPFFVNNQVVDINTLPFIIRIKLDTEKMIDKETSLLDIKTKFIAHWYKNYTNIKNLKKNEKEVISRITKCAIISNNSTDTEQIIHIRFNMSSFNYNIITDFLNMIFDDITLKGIENIDDIEVVQERIVEFSKNTGAVSVDKEYVVYTSGINFNKLRLIKGIDFNKTRCNDIITIYKMYGIEATRQIIINELYNTYAENGAIVNINHLSLVVDHMCHLGEVISIDRHGMGKIDADPFVRASFEQQMEHFINAAIFNEKDVMKSVSSRIMMGRVIQGGTGSFELLLDTKKLEKSEYTENESGGRITFTPLEEEPLLLDIVKYDNNKMDFFLPQTF